jgi:hypothetical protein
MSNGIPRPVWNGRLQVRLSRWPRVLFFFPAFRFADADARLPPGRVLAAAFSPAAAISSPKSSDRSPSARILSDKGPLLDSGSPLPALAMRSFSSTVLQSIDK